MAKGKLLYNRVSCNEHARVSLRDGWQDIAWGLSDCHAKTLEGNVIAVSAHRMTLGVGDGHMHVLRRVDIEAIEVGHLGGNAMDIGYSLIIKDDGPLDDRERHVSQWLNANLGDEYAWRIHTKLTYETVVILNGPDTLKAAFNDWFVRDTPIEPPFPNGALLHWREIVPGDGGVGLTG